MFRQNVEKFLRAKPFLGKAIGIGLCAGLFILSNGYSEGYDLIKEMDELKMRVQQLEGKKEAPLSNISFHGVMVGSVQSLSSQETQARAVRESRGTFLFQPTVSVDPTENDQFFFKCGFAAGNGLAGVSPFNLSLWATDMEDDVRDINGRNRDYLLTAYYKHAFSLGSQRLEVLGGLIERLGIMFSGVYSLLN